MALVFSEAAQLRLGEHIYIYMCQTLLLGLATASIFDVTLLSNGAQSS